MENLSKIHVKFYKKGDSVRRGGGIYRIKSILILCLNQRPVKVWSSYNNVDINKIKIEIISNTVINPYNLFTSL